MADRIEYISHLWVSLRQILYKGTRLMKRIVIYAPNNVVEMSIALMKDLCWVASSYALASDNSALDPNECVKLVSLDTVGVRSFSGNTISTDLVLYAQGELDGPEPDAILLGAYWGHMEETIHQNQALIEWLQRAHQQSIPIAAVSNAPIFLAASGLLNDKVATVYPPYANAFRKRYPQVNLKEQRAITDAGNLYCANGIASGCDLIISIIEQMYGPVIARQISEEFLLGFNRSYTLANVSFDGQKFHQDKSILMAQQLLERNYSDNVNVQDIAEDIGMSPRNFSRRFKAATGDTPSGYLQRVRIEAAKDLLKHSTLSISEIAYRTGFSDASHLGRLLRKLEGKRPKTYRAYNP